MNNIRRGLLYLALAVIAPVHSQAAEVYVPLRTLSVYALTVTSTSQAHLVSVGGGGIFNNGTQPHPSCGFRMYIDPADKQLFATVLAASLANKQMAFTYDDAATTRNLGYHGTHSCKLLSVWGF